MTRPKPKRPRPRRSPAAPTKPGAPAVVLPSRAKRVYAGVFGVAFFALLVANATVVKSIHLSAIPLALVVLCDLACVRVGRLKVVADERGLVIRNYLRSHRLRWADVAEFRLAPPGTALEGYQLSVALEGGKVIRLDASRRALRRSPAKDQAALEPARKELAAWLRYARAQDPGSTAPAV